MPPYRFALAFLLAAAALPAAAQTLPACTAERPFPYSDKSFSVAFIIDNSSSMAEMDPDETRFKLVMNLLDSLHRFAPRSEAALVVYTRRLMFDWRENNFFHPLFPGDSLQGDSYVPLTGLRATVGGRPGVDTLKALLRHDGSGELVHVTRLPAVRKSRYPDPFNTRDGTDITLGMDAAKRAMESSQAAPEDRVFVLLSDGEPFGVDSSRMDRQMDFVAGEGYPTTHLTYFRRTPGPAPTSLVTMVENIRANGYSTRNPSSAYVAGMQSSELIGKHLADLIACNPFTPASIRPRFPMARSIPHGTPVWTALGRSRTGKARGFPLREESREPALPP